MHTPVLEKEIKRQYLFELYLHILLSLDVVGLQYKYHVCEWTLIAIDVQVHQLRMYYVRNQCVK